MLVFILLSLATYRVTRLITKDTFPPVAKLRTMIVGKDERKFIGTRLEWLGELLTCYWCASVWVAGVGVLIVSYLWETPPYALMMWPAAAAVSAFISHIENYYDEVTRVLQ